MRSMLVLSLLAVLPTSALAEQTEPERLVAFEIEDQLKRPHSHEEFADRVAVFLWADREGSDGHMARWQQALEQELSEEIAGGTVQLRGVAHVKGAPFFVKGKIRGRFGEDPDRWTLLDWKGVFAENYGFGEAHLVAMVFDAEGQLRQRLAVEDMETVDVSEIVVTARSLAGAATPTD